MDTLYAESAYYRLLFAERTQDLPFYLRVTDGLGEREVLELGVGDGRVALALAAASRRVLGVDASESMLAALSARLAASEAHVRARVRAMHGDARTFRIDERFARILCPFNGIAHFHTDDELSLFLETVRLHLAPGGLFAFDAMIPDPALRSGGAAVPWLTHPRTGAVCRLEECYCYDPEKKVLTIETTFVERESGARQVLVLGLRQLDRDETPVLLERAGFRILERDDSIGDSLAYVCAIA